MGKANSGSFKSQYKDNKERILKNVKEVWHERLQSYCWIWQNWCNHDGYGRTVVAKQKISVHKLSYVTFIGPIPDDLFVMHECDTPACCNPTHLRLGTHQDNVDDMMTKNRKCKGEGTNTNKLIAAQIPEICTKWASGKYDSYAMLALDYGVSRHAIRDVITCKRWKHIPR